MVGSSFTSGGTRWLVVASDADGVCTVVAVDPLRESTFDEQTTFARVPLAVVAAALDRNR